MKNLKLLMLLATVAMTISCAGPKSNQGVSDIPYVSGTDTPYVPGSVAPGLDPGSEYGGTATLNIVSIPIMGDYTGRSMNNPQDIKINLNMVLTSGGTYGGTTTITYKDNGISYKGYFTAGSSAQATTFNRAFSYGGKPVWHGVFEDFMGGVVVVLDDIVDLGDGAGTEDLASGTFWFKNFGLTYAPHPPTYCWFVSLGPYDCRPWPSGKGMNTYASADPGAGYIKLGSFTGMSLKKAFNGGQL